MKAVSINKLKKELATLTAEDLLETCLKMAKYKKENKELLSYLLFDSNYEPEYINSIKNDIDQQFSVINLNNMYYAMKGIRKTLRTANKYIHYSGIKRTEVELRIYFCQRIIESGIPIKTSTALYNLFNGQMLKITKAVSMLHEDLQFDYHHDMKSLYNHLFKI